MWAGAACVGRGHMCVGGEHMCGREAHVCGYGAKCVVMGHNMCVCVCVREEGLCMHAGGSIGLDRMCASTCLCM